MGPGRWKPVSADLVSNAGRQEATQTSEDRSQSMHYTSRERHTRSAALHCSAQASTFLHYNALSRLACWGGRAGQVEGVGGACDAVCPFIESKLHRCGHWSPKGKFRYEKIQYFNMIFLDLGAMAESML